VMPAQIMDTPVEAYPPRPMLMATSAYK
jgi:hypothetical protein